MCSSQGNSISQGLIKKKKKAKCKVKTGVRQERCLGNKIEGGTHSQVYLYDPEDQYFLYVCALDTLLLTPQPLP